MLVGAILGAIIVILGFVSAFYRGAATALRDQNLSLAKDFAQSEKSLVQADQALKNIHDANLTLGEQLKKMQQAYIINFTDDQLTHIAALISKHVQMLAEAHQA